MMVLLALLVAGSLAAQAPDTGDASAPRDRTFEDSVSVVEVELPVRVLRNGVPVPGLTRDDFEVLDRGVAQTITDFGVQDLRASRLSESGGTIASVRRAEQRNMLFVFDLNQLNPIVFQRTRPKIESWLLTPRGAADRVALAVHGSADGRTPRSKSLRLLTPFVRDPEQLRLALDVVARIFDRKPRRTEAALDALHALQAQPAARADLQATVREVGIPVALHLLATPFSDTSALGRLGDPRTTRGLVEERPFRAVPDGRGLFGDTEFRISSGSPESRFRWLTLAMAEVVTLLAELDGQNHVVLVTQPGYPGLDDTYTTGRLEPMHNAFRRTGWTFHAVDTTGVGFGGDTLFYMTNETGGELIENQLELDQALDRLALRTDLTYRLSFRPSDLGEPGSYHRLKVRLTGDGGAKTKIQHRAGYYAPRPDGEVVEEQDWFELDAMLRDDRRFDETSLVVDATPTATGVDLALRVDLGTFLVNTTPSDRTRARTLSATLAAVDGDGTIVDRFDEQIEVAAGDRALSRNVSLTVAPGRYRIRALVRESSSGALALTTRVVGDETPGGDRTGKRGKKKRRGE